MIELTIVKAGDLLLQPGESPFSANIEDRIRNGVAGASTVTYLTDGRIQIIVDTGFGLESNMSPAWRARNLDALGKSLAAQGIHPEGIDFVFITHWHKDHFGNLPLFRNARILTEAHAYEYRFRDGRFRDYLRAVEKIDVESIRPIRSEDQIIEGVRVVTTPGHTIDHASLLVSVDRGVVAIAGDAILDEAIFRRKAVWKHNPDFWSEAAVLETCRMLAAKAYAIVPGHGHFFACDARGG